MRDFELAIKAVGDPTRTRILKLAGLVEDQRDGKWIEYALIDESRNPHAKSVLQLLKSTLDRDPAVMADRKRLREIKAIPMTQLCALPAAKVPMPAKSSRHRKTRKDRAHV